MEAISAREAIMAITKSQVMTVIQMTPAVPPFLKPKFAELYWHQSSLVNRVPLYEQQGALPCTLKADNETNHGYHPKISLLRLSALTDDCIDGNLREVLVSCPFDSCLEHRK